MNGDKKAKRSNSSRGATEVFKVIHGITTEKQMVEVDNEETKRRSRWQDMENEQKVLAKKVKHRDDRSSRSASRSSQRA